MDQPTFADLEYESKKRETRREIFLERMDSLIPWEQLEERIRQFYPKEGRGRPYVSAMLRIHCVQLFYNLSLSRAETNQAMLRIHCVQLFYNLSDCQGRRQIRPCGGAKVYQLSIGVQRKCHPATGLSRSR